ncbi:uncharacterized protein [Magallana gigas]|uniref:uncharacterized protein n=1 Tax=Magallana gigas TaxID=29159 RepID=UPI0033425886
MAAVSVMQCWLILTSVICLFNWVEASKAGHKVDTCPETKDLWESRAASESASCGGVSEYHCLRDKDGKKRELCLEKTRILQGNCPIVTEKGFLNWEPCNESLPGCPDNHYLSNEVYKFPFCFGNNTSSSIKSANKDTEEDSDIDIIVPVVIVILVAVVVVLGLIYYLRIQRNRGPNYEPKDEEVCLMENDKRYSRAEIVKKDHVQQGLAALQKHDALLITGMLGTAVTSTAESIMKEFSNSESHSGWSFKLCKCQELPVKFDPKTIYFVYGWFGLYNDNPCSMNDVKIYLNTINSTLKKKPLNKFIIGLRSDFYRRYGSDLEDFEDLFHKSMSLDSVNKMRDQGYEDHLKNKIKNACSNSECLCRRLTFDMIMDKKEGKIGIPLKLAILTNDHDLIATFLEYKNFKKTLMENFKSLKTSDLDLYQCVMYVCLKGDLKCSEDVDKRLVNSMHFNISKESVEQKMSVMGKYVRMRKSDERQKVEASKATYVFWHPFIYICAFHALFESNPEDVVKYCNLDAILQLVRPPSKSDRKTNYFTVTATEEQVKIFQGRIKSEGQDEMYAAHPLLEFK